MAKVKKQFVCVECGANHLQWNGQCSVCACWNSLKEFKTATSSPQKNAGNHDGNKITPLSAVESSQNKRLSTGFSELDRTLGGGLVTGSVVLLGGDPGIGKSTIVLQCLAALDKKQTTLYVSGEESNGQISLRAKRLSVTADILLLSETNLEAVHLHLEKLKPKIIVIDSIQTMFSEQSSGAAGSISQVRDCASQLTLYAKQNDAVLLLIGHVTKEGALAGPRILEHMVDVVLYFEGDMGQRYRLIRAVKNRFGAVNEISVYAMTQTGLKQVENPSAIFLSQQENVAPGRVVSVVREGTKPLLIEIQALLDQALGQPKRVCLGFDYNRLVILLAVLHKHTGVNTADQDVFINVVGGVKVLETATDLAVIFAVYSSLTNKAINQQWLIFGEVGLTGEIRPVYNGAERLKEASKQGFKLAIIPKANQPKTSIAGLKVIAVSSLKEALSALQKN